MLRINTVATVTHSNVFFSLELSKVRIVVLCKGVIANIQCFELVIVRFQGRRILYMYRKERSGQVKG